MRMGKYFNFQMSFKMFEQCPCFQASLDLEIIRSTAQWPSCVQGHCGDALRLGSVCCVLGLQGWEMCRCIPLHAVCFVASGFG